MYLRESLCQCCEKFNQIERSNRHKETKKAHQNATHKTKIKYLISNLFTFNLD